MLCNLFTCVWWPVLSGQQKDPKLVLRGVLLKKAGLFLGVSVVDVRAILVARQFEAGYNIYKANIPQPHASLFWTWQLVHLLFELHVPNCLFMLMTHPNLCSHHTFKKTPRLSGILMSKSSRCFGGFFSKASFLLIKNTSAIWFDVGKWVYEGPLESVGFSDTGLAYLVAGEMAVSIQLAAEILHHRTSMKPCK